jgi:circadian clock protein KaiB
VDANFLAVLCAARQVSGFFLPVARPARQGMNPHTAIVSKEDRTRDAMAIDELARASMTSVLSRLSYGSCATSDHFIAGGSLREDKLSKFILKLYVAGSTPRAMSAIENLRRVCEKDLPGQYELQVIDVLKNPELAEKDKVLATPTLIKQLPPPLRRVIGDLSDSEKILLGLELRQVDTSL